MASIRSQTGMFPVEESGLTQKGFGYRHQLPLYILFYRPASGDKEHRCG
jgi:hypothetical protein